MASQVQILLDNICKLLADNNIPTPMKNVLLMTLKFMVEQLYFYVEVGGKSNNLPLDTPMGMLWPVIEALYDYAEKLRKKDSLKDNALQLQIVIMKVSPNEFLKEKSYLLVQT
jgi:hypothetical protein